MMERVRYCWNKDCEAYNHSQGDAGIPQDQPSWDCICGYRLTKKNNKPHGDGRVKE